MGNYNERYARHYALSDFGKDGQEKLLRAKVLVVGAGGLGCPVLQYLAAAGIGTLGIADHDLISLSNLQRQILFNTEDIGFSKAEIASARLQKLNPEIKIKTHTEKLCSQNAWDIISQYDIVADCTDNFTVRYLINDVCVLLDKPLIFGAVYRYEGQVAVFNSGLETGDKTSYRHLFPKPPQPEDTQNCSDIGVLGVLPGMIGLMQANEIIKLIAGIGDVLAGKMLTFNMLTYETFIIDISEINFAEDHIPKDRASLEATNYEGFCEVFSKDIEELNMHDFLFKNSAPDTATVDVREVGELPAAEFSHIHIPLSELNDKLSEINEKHILLFCKTGKRSLKAAEILMEHFGNKKIISHLKGGITALQERKNGHNS